MPPVTDVDVPRLEQLYLECSAELRAIHQVVDILKSENDHLRLIIDSLISSIHER